MCVSRYIHIIGEKRASHSVTVSRLWIVDCKCTSLSDVC